MSPLVFVANRSKLLSRYYLFQRNGRVYFIPVFSPKGSVRVLMTFHILQDCKYIWYLITTNILVCLNSCRTHRRRCLLACKRECVLTTGLCVAAAFLRRKRLSCYFQHLESAPLWKTTANDCNKQISKKTPTHCKIYLRSAKWKRTAAKALGWVFPNHTASLYMNVHASSTKFLDNDMQFAHSFLFSHNYRWEVRNYVQLLHKEKAPFYVLNFGMIMNLWLICLDGLQNYYWGKAYRLLLSELSPPYSLRIGMVSSLLTEFGYKSCLRVRRTSRQAVVWTPWSCRDVPPVWRPVLLATNCQQSTYEPTLIQQICKVDQSPQTDQACQIMQLAGPLTSPAQCL